MKGKITSPGNYTDGAPRFEIGIYPDESLLNNIHLGVRNEIKLKIGPLIYTAGINSTEKAGMWIAPDIYDYTGVCERIRLSKVLIKNGFKINEEIELMYNAESKLLEVLEINIL